MDHEEVSVLERVVDGVGGVEGYDVAGFDVSFWFQLV